MDKYITALKMPSTIEQVLNRVRSADPISPITVILHKGALYDYFARTVQTQRMLEDSKCVHVGTFNNQIFEGTVERKLKRALEV